MSVMQVHARLQPRHATAAVRVALLTLALAPAALPQRAGPVAYTPPPPPGPNLPLQVLGPNDLISVSVDYAPEMCRTIRIGADGYIRLPLLTKRIKAAGLYPADLENAIADDLKEGKILVRPFVQITVVEYHSRPISVSGAVRLPVVFQAEGPVTLLEALARAQGLRDDAGREILVTTTAPGADGKAATLTRRILVRSLIDAANPDVNLKLTGGEEVRVPEVGRIYVVGNVKKPGVFPVQDGAETTVLQALALAEGLMPYTTKAAYIYRREAAGGKNEIPVELSQIMQRKAPDVPLQADDILYVPESHGMRLSAAALEKIILFGSTAGATALIYSRIHP